MTNEVSDFFQDFLLLATAFSGVFLGLGFLFIGLVTNNFPFIIVGMVSLLMGILSATVLNAKKIKR